MLYKRCPGKVHLQAFQRYLWRAEYLREVTRIQCILYQTSPYTELRSPSPTIHSRSSVSLLGDSRTFELCLSLRPLTPSACLWPVSNFPIFSIFVHPMPSTKEVLTHWRVKRSRKEGRHDCHRWPLMVEWMEQSADCQLLEQEKARPTPSVPTTCLILKEPIDKPPEHTCTRMFSSAIGHKRNTFVFGSRLSDSQSSLTFSGGANTTSAIIGKLSSFLMKG